MIENFVFTFLLSGTPDEPPELWTFKSGDYVILKADWNLIVLRQIPYEGMPNEQIEMIVDLTEANIRRRPAFSDIPGESVGKIL